MNSRSNTFMMIALQALFLFTLVACQDTIPYRSTPSAQIKDPNGPQCPEGEEPHTEVGDDGEEIIVCRPKPITRPTDAVFWKNDFCVCQDKKAISYGPTCATFCSDKETQGSQTLFASFNVSDSIGLGNLYAWCKTSLPGDPSEQNPNCEMLAEDQAGNITPMEVYLKPNGNSLEVRNIQNYLKEDSRYLMTLIETNSQATSDTTQLIIYSDNGEGQGGALRQSPITQYQCMRRLNEVSEGNSDIYSMHAFPLHFYFVGGLPPATIPAGTPSIFCHDIFTYGAIDSAFYPRLKERAGVFNVWDLTDPRFANGTDGRMIANASIIKKAKIYGTEIPADRNFFHEFPWMTGPQFQTEGSGNNSSEAPSLGYFMSSWIDSQTMKSFCLNNTHYKGEVPLYRAIGEVVGAETEGIYIAEKEPTPMQGSDGQYYQEEKDFILIKESDLKAVWFEIRPNEAPRAPTSEDVANKAVYLYYPFNKDTPYDKTTEQRLYRVKSALELGRKTPEEKPIQPHDKKIGCVPKF